MPNSFLLCNQAADHLDALLHFLREQGSEEPCVMVMVMELVMEQGFRAGAHLGDVGDGEAMRFNVLRGDGGELCVVCVCVCEREEVADNSCTHGPRGGWPAVRR